MGAVLYNALLENSTSELGSMQWNGKLTKNAKDMFGKLAAVQSDAAGINHDRAD